MCELCVSCVSCVGIQNANLERLVREIIVIQCDSSFDVCRGYIFDGPHDSMCATVIHQVLSQAQYSETAGAVVHLLGVNFVPLDAAALGCNGVSIRGTHEPLNNLGRPQTLVGILLREPILNGRQARVHQVHALWIEPTPNSQQKSNWSVLTV